MLSLAHFGLTSCISEFTGILPMGALVLEFKQEWRFNEAPRTKRIRTSSCCRRTVDYRVHTTVPWSQKLSTVGRTAAHLWHAWVPVRLGTTVCPQFFCRLYKFCNGRLQTWVFFVRKTRLGDFSRAFSPYFPLNPNWIKGCKLFSWLNRRLQSIKVRFPLSHFVIMTQVCIFNHVFEFVVCDWDYWND